MVIALTGHKASQIPQPKHFAVSITAFLFTMVTALQCAGFSHLPHPMHLSSSVTTAPLSSLTRAFIGHTFKHGASSHAWQVTGIKVFTSRNSWILMREKYEWHLPKCLIEHAISQLWQPVHLSGSITRTFSSFKAMTYSSSHCFFVRHSSWSGVLVSLFTHRLLPLVL